MLLLFSDNDQVRAEEKVENMLQTSKSVAHGNQGFIT